MTIETRAVPPSETKTNGRTVVRPPDLRMLPLAQIGEDPNNPRRTFDGLEELAENIAQHGVLEPIMVREVSGGLPFMVVFGARRVRAAKLAKLAQIPAIVRADLDDAGALELALVENAKRVDVPVIEEAEAFEMLHTKFRLSAEDIAAKVGKSRGYVYQRMKLTSLCKGAREAFRAGKIHASSALYIARLPTEKIQLEALEEVGEHKTQWGIKEALSAREASKVIQERFMLRLVDAGFDVTSETLLANAPACSKCPKRTGAQPELFADVESKDLCTDAKCFGEKRDAAWVQRSKAALDAGQTVLKGNAAKEVFAYNDSLAAGWRDLDGECFHDTKRRKWREVLAKDLPAASLVRAPGGAILEVITDKAATAAAKRLGLSWATPAARIAEHGEKAKAPKDPKARAEAAKLEHQREVLDKTKHLLIGAVVAASSKRETFPKGFWRLVFDVFAQVFEGAEVMVARRGVELEKGITPERWLEKLVSKASEDEMRALVIEALITDPYGFSNGKEKGTFLGRACELYKVDAKPIAAKARELVDAKHAKAAEDEAKAKLAKTEAAAKKPATSAGSAKKGEQNLVKVDRKSSKAKR